MMRKSSYFSTLCGSIALLLVALCLDSCRKDFDLSHVGVRDYKTSWVTNLVDAEASIGDFVPDTVTGAVSLITNPDDRSFYIAYELDYHTDTLDIKKLLQIDSLVGTEVGMLENPSYPMDGSTSFEMVIDFPFAKVDTIYMKEGTLELHLSTPLDTTGMNAEFQSNLLLEEKGGTLQPFRYALHFGKNTISLKDKYIIVNDSNILRAKVSYSILPFTGPYADSAKAPLYIRYNASIPYFHYITGEIYRDTSIELSSGKVGYSMLPEKMDFGLHLNHLFLYTDIATNVGIPVCCDIGYMKFHNNMNDKTYDFLTDRYSLKVNVPSFRGMTSHTRDTIRINREAVFSNDGYLDFTAYISLKKGRFFIDENASYDVNAHLEFPLDITVEQFRYADTFDFPTLGAIDSSMDSDGWQWVQSLLLRCEFINGLPLDMNVQLYFIDSNYRVLDSLFTDRSLLQGAVVDPLTGLVKEPVRVPAKFISFDRDRVRLLSRCRYMLLYADAASTGKQRVLLTADQKLRVRIGARVNAKANFKN